MFRSFFRTREWFVWAWGGGTFLLLSLYFQVELTVKINSWYGGFYNILQKATEHTVTEFWAEMIKFAYIAFPYVLLPQSLPTSPEFTLLNSERR
jgi:peptide/bleomycin uptake transporter